MHVLPDEHHLVTKHCNKNIDCTYLWDLRYLKRPALDYGTFFFSMPCENVGRGLMNKHCYVDFSSGVMSCYHVDGMLRLWNVKNGEKLAETNELNGGVYSENWSMNHNKPGILGLNNGIVWLPLRNKV